MQDTQCAMEHPCWWATVGEGLGALSLPVGLPAGLVVQWLDCSTAVKTLLTLGSGNWVKVDSAFHPSEVGIEYPASWQEGGAVCSLQN